MSITVYSKPACTQCRAVKRHLDSRGVDYKEVDMSSNQEALNYVLDKGFRQAPVVDMGEGTVFSGYRPDLIDSVMKTELKVS